MRFMMMMMKATPESEASAPPPPALLAAMEKLTADMAKAGVMLATAGLAPSSMGTRIVASQGRLSVVDGPFAETKELIAGFALVQGKSKEEVMEWGIRFMKIHQEMLGPTWEGISEIRQAFSPDDLGCH